MPNNVIAVAMSGGVDSATVGAMLLDKNKDVFGVTMYLHKHSEMAAEEAAKVCKSLGIEHFIFDLSGAFSKKIIGVFKHYYENGLTPNPCALCNRDIKIGILLEKAIEKGATLMATGHYARNNDKIALMEAVDKVKDQSYFLSLVKKSCIQKIICPLGNVASKNETRTIAKRLGLDNFLARESQDICFIPDNDYKNFLCSLSLIPNPGEIIHVETGNILGVHNGVFHYTIGQRKGLGISHKEPLYVIKIDPKKNIVYVGSRDFLYKNFFEIDQCNWFVDMPKIFDCSVKIRATCKKLNAKVAILSDFSAKITLLEQNEVPIAAGQICAIYQNEIVLGGGVII